MSFGSGTVSGCLVDALVVCDVVMISLGKANGSYTDSNPRYISCRKLFTSPTVVE